MVEALRWIATPKRAEQGWGFVFRNFVQLESPWSHLSAVGMGLKMRATQIELVPTKCPCGQLKLLTSKQPERKTLASCSLGMYGAYV
jgi:hypothetical protein